MQLTSQATPSRLVEQRKSPTSRKSSIEISEDKGKFKLDLDNVLKRCNTIQDSVKKTRQMWGRSKTSRKVVKSSDRVGKSDLRNLLKAPMTKMPDLQSSRSLKNNLLSIPKKLTFEKFTSDKVIGLLVKNKRDFGSTEAAAETDKELERKKRVFIEKITFDPVCRVPFEFLDDKYIKNYNFKEFKKVIELNLKSDDIKDFKYKHIRTERGHTNKYK